MPRFLRHSRTILRVLALGMLLPFIVGTTPVPLYYQFIVQGRVLRLGTGSPVNHTVALLGNGAGDPRYRVLVNHRDDTKEPNAPVGLTDDAGQFSLAVTPDWGTIDSLRLGVTIAGDTTLHLGEPFGVTDHDQVAEERRMMASREEAGCSCATEPAQVPYTAGYIYRYNGRTVTVP